jgi:U3 small nucleolar RNA-associated protein 6
MNKESVELWVEYIKFELGFVETLRRRWEVLGIAPGKTKGDEEEVGVEEVLRGAIVKTVIEEGSKALGGNVGFFKRVLEVVEDYPLTDPGMRSEARKWVYEMVKEWCWEMGEGRWLYTQRDLPSVGNDVWDMDVLRARHEEMLGSMREEWRGREGYESLYGTWLGTMAGTASVDALVSDSLVWWSVLMGLQRRYLLLSFLHAGVGGRDLRLRVKSMM